MAKSARATRSSAKTPTKKARVDATGDTPKDGDSRYFSNSKDDSDALDDDEEEHDAPKKRRGAAKKKEPTRKKRKLSSDEDEDDNDSDALDDDFEEDDKDEDAGKRRKRTTKRIPAKAKKTASTQKRREKAADEDDFAVDEEDLDDGQEVVGVVVQAPKTGHVPPGQISQNTLDFLTKLKDPACNDRDWFKLHEPVYRHAEKEWKAFVEAFTEVLVEVDEQIPPLPPKDVIHRIYRDVRFSNDKTPYKKGFSASFSRSGRKGIFAHYHIAVKPGNESIIAAGSWCPGRNELVTIRSNIQRNPRRLRQVLANPDFVRFFGEPTPHPKGERQSIFGNEDELKVAPKGVSKDDKDIDLLKCRSFAVVHKFTDSEVLSPEFKEIIGAVATIMQPLVHCLNDMMTIQEAGSSDEGEEADGDEED